MGAIHQALLAIGGASGGGGLPALSLVFIDGSEHWATAVDKFKTSTFGSHSAPAAGVAGAHGKVTDDSVWDSHGLIITATSTISARGRFRIRVLGNEELILLKNGSTVHIALELLSSGAIRVTGGGGAFTHTTSSTYSIDTWYEIELIATIHDSTGSYKLLIDGAVPAKSGGGTMEGTGLDTRNGATSTIDRLLFGGGTTIDTYVDDHAIDASGNEIGLGQVETLYPNGAGDLAEMTRGGADSGANWSQCDEATQNGNTDYVVTTVNGSTFKNQLRIGGVNYDGTVTHTAISGYKCYTDIWNTNPATGLAWTDSDINSLQAGILGIDANQRDVYTFQDRSVTGTPRAVQVTTSVNLVSSVLRVTQVVVEVWVTT